jgi:hypothetical protein
MDSSLPVPSDRTQRVVAQAAVVLARARHALASKQEIADRANRWLRGAELRADRLQAKMIDVKYARVRDSTAA